MEQQAQEQKKKSPIRLIILIAVLLVAGYFIFDKIKFALTHETTDDAEVEGQITPVLPRVSGYIKTLYVRDYDSVKSGQLVAEIDDADLLLQLKEMEATLAQTKIDIVNARATLNNALVALKVNKGNIDLSELRLKKAQQDLDRDKNLFAAEAITKKQLDDSQYNYETALQQYQNSHKDYNAADSRLAVLRASVEKAEASIAVQQAKIDQQKLKLTYTKIFAPQSGKIGKRNVSEGQFVQEGTPLFSIVDNSTYWVVANFKENQLRHLYRGKKVEINIDAYPNLKITGTIANLSDATGAKFALLPPDNSSGNFVKVTQRVPVKINFDNIDQFKDLLRAGLSVYVVANNK
ncbi:MAG: HlyD family efflux transporter periplasmic adaptor subunit [Sphingobacteriales bacterium]|uniref:HlyD family secretion protein n=1 Tax=Hydrotalea flava TaxID=714549 RepID=UPI00082C96E6|nr:HlyD family secretion protein [Hydrotalea flava]RTL56576.1 MAG: HlyD family efflux transporter periplasmic adaptor subunit [Sphingobacteriales bacterium]